MHKPEFIHVTYIETTPEKLWEALTSSEFSRRFPIEALFIRELDEVYRS